MKTHRRKQYYVDGPKPKDQNQYHATIGSQPLLPPNMSKKQFLDLRKKWYDKLTASGFTDIEAVDHKTGKVYAHFRSQNKSAASHASNTETYRPDKIEYFRYCRAFYEHAHFGKLFGVKYRWVYRRLLQLHIEGETYRGMAAHFKSTKVPKRHRRKVATEFWSHWHMAKLLKVMWAWHVSHPEGLDYDGA